MPPPIRHPSQTKRRDVGKVVCAWCENEMGEFDGDGVSHGICGTCLKERFGMMLVNGDIVELASQEEIEEGANDEVAGMGSGCGGTGPNYDRA